MDAVIDQSAYFRRIGYDGDVAPTLETLRALHCRHAQAIAFENLSSLAGEVVSLQPAFLQRKLIEQRRGGYCFEHNSLFWQVLEQLGFEVRGLAARVLWGRRAGARVARGHMLLQVRIEDQIYLADVGFGGLTLTAPLLLQPNCEQTTPHEAFRLVPEDDGMYRMEALLAGSWSPLYRFDLEFQSAADYEVWNWWTCTHPQSPFVTSLMMARPEADGRHALINNKYSYYSRQNSAVQSYSLQSLQEMKRVIEQAFAIQAPTSAALDAKLTQLIGSNTA